MADARNPLIALGALNAAIAVATGAIAAHSLHDHPREVFDTAARYHMYHAFAMILAGVLGARTQGWIFQVGIVLFCGSLYVLAFAEVKALGPVTPLGGLAFLAGWVWLAARQWSAARSPSTSGSRPPSRS